MADIIRLTIDNNIAHIILDNPPDNRMNINFFKSLRDVIDTLKNNHIGAAVMYGSGRHFSAGADVEDIKGSIIEFYDEGLSMEEVVNKSILQTAQLFNDIENLPFPIIAAINGFCAGSGLELALVCSMRIGSPECIIGLPEITWGLITGCGGSIRLGRLVGKAKAKELILRGDMIKGIEAYSLGIISRMVKRDEVVPYALEIARNFVQNGKMGEGRPTGSPLQESPALLS